MDVIEQWLARAPENLAVQQALLKKGLQFYEQFLKQQPTDTAVRAEMAANHSRVAGIRRLLGQYDLAAEHSRQALSESRALAELEPGKIEHRRQWAESSNWLGEALRLAGKSSDAEQAYAEAIEIGEQLHRDRPQEADVAGELARAQYNLGLLLLGGGKMPEAEQSFEKAIALADEAAAIHPRDEKLRQHLARCHINLGMLLKGTQRPLEADREYRAAIGLLERLTGKADSDPELRLELAVAFMDRGNLLLARRDDARLADGEPLAGAVTAYLSAIERLEPLSAEYPAVPRYRKELAASYNGLGSVLLLQANLADARKAWQEARSQQESLIAASPKLADYRSALGLTLGNLALIDRRENNFDAARQLLEDAIQHQLEAAQLAEGNVSYLRFLSNHRQSLARLHLAQGEHALAASQAEQLAAAEAKDWQDAYQAAKLIARCIPLAMDDAAQQEDYARRTVACLQRAIQKGFRDIQQLDQDEDCTPLRTRADFQKLVSDIKSQ